MRKFLLFAASLRNTDSISPNRHVELENNENLIDMINHIRQVTGKPVGFKAVFGDKTWLCEFLAAIKKTWPRICA